MLYILILIFLIVAAGMWKAFEKAGKPGIAAIIPFYNFYVMVQISGKPALWFLLLFVPPINIALMVLIFVGIAKRFGKGTLFGLGLAFLTPIFFPILGFGDAQYQGGPQFAKAPAEPSRTGVGMR